MGHSAPAEGDCAAAKSGMTVTTTAESTPRHLTYVIRIAECASMLFAWRLGK
jgi:hypothetical protein